MAESVSGTQGSSIGNVLNRSGNKGLETLESTAPLLSASSLLRRVCVWSVLPPLATMVCCCAPVCFFFLQLLVFFSTVFIRLFCISSCSFHEYRDLRFVWFQVKLLPSHLGFLLFFFLASLSQHVVGGSLIWFFDGFFFLRYFRCPE